MKTFYLKILHAGMSYSYADVRADSFEISEGAYIFSTRTQNPKDPDFEYDKIICAYPVALTIIESIEEDELKL